MHAKNSCFTVYINSLSAFRLISHSELYQRCYYKCMEEIFGSDEVPKTAFSAHPNRY